MDGQTDEMELYGDPKVDRVRLAEPGMAYATATPSQPQIRRLALKCLKWIGVSLGCAIAGYIGILLAMLFLCGLVFSIALPISWMIDWLAPGAFPSLK